MIHSSTALMRAVLYQGLHCPYCGKTMELLSHKLAQLHPSTICPGNELKRYDDDRIMHAAEALSKLRQN